MGFKNTSSSIALILLGLSKMAYTLPTDPNVIHGDVSVHSMPNGLVITSGDKAIIDWKSFSIKEGNFVQFAQANSHSKVLNRVTGGRASEILGNLSSNGNVILINSSGIIFGAGAVVNTNSFIASTLDALNEDFLKGGDITFKGDGPGTIKNLGTITALDGDVILLSRQVENHGSLDGQNTLIGAGQEILLKPLSSERIFIRPLTSVDLTNEVQAYSYAIKNSGSITAVKKQISDGKIFLVADKGFVESTGLIASEGGTVHLLGDTVAVHEYASIDVSSKSNGGTILLGGDFQGKNPDIANSQDTFVGKEVILNASSAEDGNGGKVIVWSDGMTRCYGNITAEGGRVAGDGGLIEASGKMSLEYKGFSSTAANSETGKTGTFLLDPHNITITAAANSGNIVFGGACGALTYCTTNVAPTPANIQNTDIQGHLAANNVIVTTNDTGGVFGDSGTIAILAPIEWNTNNSLTFTAADDIYVAAPIICNMGGAISLNAGNHIFIGSQDAIPTPAVLKSCVASFAGLVTLTTTVNNILVGNNLVAFPVQVGYNPFFATAPNLGAPSGDITINTHAIFGLTGGSGAQRCYAQVGHGAVPAFGAAVAVMPGISGEINITATESILITGGGNGTNDQCYAQIGHGGFDVNFMGATSTVTGNINVTSEGAALLMTGSLIAGANTLNYARIGHLGSADTMVPLATPVTVMGGAGTDIKIHTHSGANLFGGLDDNYYTQIGHGGTNLTFGGALTGSIEVIVNTSGNGGLSLQADPVGNCAWCQIGHGGGTFINALGAFIPNSSKSILQGDITVNLASGQMIMRAGQSPVMPVVSEAYTQIGHGGLQFQQVSNGGWTGNINVSAGFSPLAAVPTLLMEAGDGAGCYTQIGHGGVNCAPDFVTGNITVSVLGLGSPGADFLMTGPTGMFDDGNTAHCQIGHGGPTITIAKNIAIPTANTGIISGNINVTVDQAIGITGATTTPAALLSRQAGGQIGHGGPNCLASIAHGATLSGNINVTSNHNSIFLIGGSGAGDTGAWIGHGYFGKPNLNPAVISGDLTVAAHNFIGVAGSTTITSPATGVIGNGLYEINPQTTFSGNQTITTPGSVLISGGLGPNGNGIISSRSGTQMITTTGGLISDVLIFGGFSATTCLGGIEANGSQIITAGGSILVAGGDNAAVASSNIAFIRNTNPIGQTFLTALQGDVFFRNGNTTNSVALLQSNNFPVPLFTGAGVIAKASFDIVIANDLQVTGSQPITFIADSNNLNKGGFKIDAAYYNNISMMPVNPTVAGVVLLSATGPIFIHSSPLFLNGTPADFQMAPTNDLSLLGLLGLQPCQAISKTGDITIDAFRDIYGTSGIGASTTLGNLEVIANNNMQLRANGTVFLGGASVTLVCDNQDPTAPGIGPGQFIKNNSTFIQSHGPVRIFTARQPQNNIQGQINGVNFVPGPQFINTNHERWGVYFFNPFFGGPGYTLFYKDFSRVPLRQAVAVSQKATSSLFYYFDEWNNYLQWSLRFTIGYDYEAYAAMFTHNEKVRNFSWFLQPFGKSPFWNIFTPDMTKQDMISSYDVVHDNEFTLPPQWKADGKQYNETIY